MGRPRPNVIAFRRVRVAFGVRAYSAAFLPEPTLLSPATLLKQPKAAEYARTPKASPGWYAGSALMLIPEGCSTIANLSRLGLSWKLPKSRRDQFSLGICPNNRKTKRTLGIPPR